MRKHVALNLVVPSATWLRVGCCVPYPIIPPINADINFGIFPGPISTILANQVSELTGGQ